MTHISRARKQRGAQAGGGRSLSHRHGRGRRHPSDAAARHRRRARLRRHACAVRGGLRRPRLSGALHRCAGRSSRRISQSRDAGMGGGDHRRAGGDRSSISPGSMAAPSEASSASAMASRRSRNGAAQPACRHLPAGGDRRLAASRRRRALCQWRALPLDRSTDRGARLLDPTIRALDQSRIGPVLTGDKPRSRRRPAGRRRC